jgi:hypothetical protein
MKNKLIESEEWKVFFSLNKGKAFTSEVDQGFGKGNVMNPISLEKINSLPDDSLYFYGKTGIGKTRLGKHYKTVAKIKGYKVCYIEEMDIFKSIFSFVYDFIDNNKNTNVFIIDDVFMKENWSTIKDKAGVVSENKYQQLYCLYNFLYKKHYEGSLIIMSGNNVPDRIFTALKKYDPEGTLTRRVREIMSCRLREKQAEDVYGTEPNV